MRRAPRRDENEPDIIAALLDLGCSVQQLDARGVPDLLVGWLGVNVLLEVKNGNKIPSKRKLTPDQERWHADWLGQVAVCETVEDALRVMSEAVGIKLVDTD